ncbi:MAG TPA: type I-C CRISPR-associated protein Cas8c/Csd1 [Bacillota bacterium]|mgnify:CR=1 FL=1|nr:type I-C CRISPR-associated protein Cas8c/Csd1 [Bacillota bacterium]HOJ58585.1 type I-C CRISPR-associated protein Cas8c/Csd1 [Bacillota bacterium]HOL02945.1 type I-C CRISPR-associated protein Cas8c/Csd1 [Bacillota bacterium]HPO80357.1 type I-C CRISPR-associated protein Cas8c/Csd1 [Bacillota bacterium]HPU61003.1 type I-C CRISPR-associated protein Cas8c/Csd1 [Bacillota bacterium]
MILQALYQLYERLLAEPGSGISPPGYSRASVSFALNLSRTGELLDLVDLRETAGGRSKRLLPRDMDVPRQVVRSSGIRANFMCDNSSYLLGVEKKKNKPVEITEDKFNEMKLLHESILEGIDDPGAMAVLSFASTWNPKQAEEHPVLSPLWDELMSGGNIVFKLDGTDGFIHQRPAIRKAWERRMTEESHENIGQCLVTGEHSSIPLIHDRIKGVTGAQSTGAALVSFNKAAFESYGKRQNTNAPVGEEAAFGYVTTLNYVLRSDRHRLRIGDTTTVFWAEKPAHLEEDILAELLDPTTPVQTPNGTDSPAKDDKVGFRRDLQATRMVRDALAQMAQGKPLAESIVDVDKDVRFYILGLAPNRSRLSVRYWHVDTFGDLLEKIGQHYSDMAIILPQWEPGSFAIWRIVNSTAPVIDGKPDGKQASPLLGGALTRAVLLGTRYPQGMYTTLLARIRAEQEVRPIQAAMIKACLVRNARISGNKAKEGSYTVSLNEDWKNTAYLLGRLFAILEKAQQEAASGAKLSTTIRNRYFGAASATPRSIFPVLLRLAQHHIAKAEYGGILDKQIEAIIGQLDGFPAHLSLEEQGNFVLGYYHQRQDFYRKRAPETQETAEEGQ